MNFAAIGYGATMIEKTITFDKYTENVEHLMSIEIEELENIINLIDTIEPSGRVSVDWNNQKEVRATILDDGDTLFVPKKNNFIHK